MVAGVGAGPAGCVLSPHECGRDAMTRVVVAVVTVAVLAAVVAAIWWIRRRGRSTPELRAAAEALQAAGQAGPALRHGLSGESAARALPSLRELLGSPAVALYGPNGI